MFTPATTTLQDLLHPGDAVDFFLRRHIPAFEPYAVGYSSSNALWLAELSRLVYRHDKEESNYPPFPTQTAFLESVGCARRQFFHSRQTGAQALLLEFNCIQPFAVLVFRGTEADAFNDIITDLKIGEVGLPNGKIETHLGFNKALDSIWPEIKAALQHIDAALYFTGHSLGGALATLAAARHRPSALYTFGSPRVGDIDFVRSLQPMEEIIHRVVNPKDIVTTLPPEILGYRHIGLTHTLAAPSDPPTTQSWFGNWGKKLPVHLADHALINYVDRI
ncbi:MAG: lipase family protein [Sideroxydans sp.]|nr:lipase family protein [Sideroxydans sp.]